MTAEFSSDRYDKLNYRRCGRSGLLLPELSLGFWQSLGEPGNESVCREVMYHAFNEGITHFDLANNYGPPPGSAEEVVGKILKDMPRDELIVSTKAGYDMWAGPYGEWGSKKYLVASLDQSLKRLGLDYVDIFYSHRPDPDTPLEETLGTLDLMVKQGKALYVGVSNYSGSQFMEAVEIIRKHNWANLLIHQPYYNMLSREPETDLLPHTEKEGVGVIAYSALAQGLLTNKYLSGVPDSSRFANADEEGAEWYEARKSAGDIEKVRQLNAIAQERGEKLSQMAIKFLLTKKQVTSVLIGVSSKAQLVENLLALESDEFSEEHLLRIDEITL